MYVAASGYSRHSLKVNIDAIHFMEINDQVIKYSLHFFCVCKEFEVCKYCDGDWKPTKVFTYEFYVFFFFLVMSL